MTEQPQNPLPDASDRTPASRRRRQVTAVSLVGAGVVTGGILAGTLSAGAATSTGAKATPAATSSTSPAAPTPGGRHGMGRLAVTGTVTAVGASSVTVKTATATTTYLVTSASTVVKGGTAGLSGVKVGDTVHLATTATGGTTVAVLVDGTLPAGGFGRFGGRGGPGGSGHVGPGRLDKTGTVTAVGTTSVTVRSGAATTTYQVTSASRLFAHGATKVTAVKVGDTVRFRTTTTGGTTIAVLVDGQPPVGAHGPGAGRGPGWGPPA